MLESCNEISGYKEWKKDNVDDGVAYNVGDGSGIEDGDKKNGEAYDDLVEGGGTHCDCENCS